MNTIYNNEILYSHFMILAEKDDIKSKSNGQLLNFYNWLYENDFLRNLTQFDYDFWLIDYDGLCLPLLKNHKITIGIDVWEDYCRIGIDPSDCFNKISQCSILVRFPLSKKEEKRFYNTLEKLLDKKSSYSKDWFNQASTSWHGSYLTFGNLI